MYNYFTQVSNNVLLRQLMNMKTYELSYFLVNLIIHD